MENTFERNTLRKKKNYLPIVYFLIVILTVIVFYYKDYQEFTKKVITTENQIIEIKSWDTFKNIDEKIDWVDSFWLDLYIKNNGPDFELQIWNYNIKENSNIWEIIESLKEPIIAHEINITTLEWWNIYDIDEYLSDKNLIEEWEYIEYINNVDKINKLTEFFWFIKWLGTLEWYLYPDTYKVNAQNFKINTFVIKQLENFEYKVYNKILLDLDNETITDIVNLASIVEKEEKNTAEKSTVAWILKKRLNSWWMIWADITVCYPHKLTAEECKMVISKYIHEKSEYNTRTMQWLPKTPIWNPSFETINATLNSIETMYWFYLHDTRTWKIYYAATNAEHEQNKRLYMK